MSDEPNSTAEIPDAQRTSLNVHGETGLWAIRSTSGAMCWLDLDHDVLIRWDPRVDSEPREARLITVCSLDVGDNGTLRVADRHQYVTDRLTGQPLATYQMWMQEPIESIARTTNIAVDA